MPEASTLQFLFQLAKGIASQFGPNCEVVVHDLDSNDPESSIVAIENGQVTGRKVGDGPSHVVLETLRGDREKLQDHLCYLTKTKDGKILKSTTIYIRNDDGTPIVLIDIGKDDRMDLRGRNFLTLKDYTADEILYLLDLAAELKEKKKKGIRGDRLKDKNIALIFEKPSTRTRCAFTVGARDEGGMPTYLSGHEIQLGDKESIADTARVLGRMFDGIEFRGFEHEYIIELAKYSGVPVWNGLTDDYHPTQCLAMLLTLREHFGHLKGLKIAYMGDGRNNTVNSLIIGSIKVGIDVTVVGSKTLWTKPEIVELVKEYGEESGAKLTLTEDLDGVIGADVIYTDVWFSMGEEKKEQERERLCRKYQVNKALMERTGKPGTIFSHCLPAVKEKEVTEEVFESEASVVFDEAENRLHTIKAIMVATLGN